MIATRPLLLGLAALANTAIWAGLICFITPILGIQLGAHAMAGICAIIFVLSLLILAMGGIGAGGDG